MKELADNSFKFDENGRKITQMGIENTVGKGEIACYEQLLSKCFKRRKLQTHENQGLFGKGLTVKMKKRCVENERTYRFSQYILQSHMIV